MKKFLSLSASVILGALPVLAVPAYRGALKAVQPDGTIITFYMRGDEHRHECLSVDGYRLMQDRNGTYRYAHVDADNRLVCDNSPIAHNPKDRKAGELKFVSSLKLAKDMTIANTPRHYANRVSSQSDTTDGAMSRFQIGNYPTKGEGRCLVLLVEFNDVKFSLSKDYHTRMLNEEGFSDNGATGSARDYYVSQSGGQFRPTFDVVGPVALSRNESYYGQDDSMLGQDVNVGKMIAEACRTAKEKYGVDFSKYDGDGDGKVDMVYVIYAGYGQNAGGGADTVWPHKYQLTSSNNQLTLDGKLIDTYACSAELFGNTGTQSAGIGTVCHEFGHVLGLADHYNTDDGTDYQLGRYDIMDYGSYNNDGKTPPSYNAFERMTVGWMTPDELSERTIGTTLENIASSNRAYVINTSNPDEFYLLENRQQTGWDSYIMGSGLMITHVDYNAKAWNANTLNNDTSHPRFCLVEADNEKGYDVILEKETEKYDLYPIATNNSFTDISTPAAKPYTGETLDKWVTDIENEDGTVRFNFMANHLAKPQGLAIRKTADGGFSASWDADDEAESYSIALSRLDYKSAQQYADRESFDRMTAGSDQNADNNSIDNRLDDFMDIKGYTGTNVFQAGGWCQIGKEGKGGSLTTPAFNFKRFGGEYAVAVTVKAPVGKQPVLSVTSNGQTGKTRINSIGRTYLFRFKGGISQTDITIATNSERALIDRIDICRGDGSVLSADAKEIAVSGTPAQTEGDIEDNDFVAVETTNIDNVKTNSHVFGALQPATFYSLAVQAVGKQGESAYSEPLTFNTSTVTSIASIHSQPATNGRAVYTIDGRRVSHMTAPGLYIVRENGSTRKVIIK